MTIRIAHAHCDQSLHVRRTRWTLAWVLPLCLFAVGCDDAKDFNGEFGADATDSTDSTDTSPDTDDPRDREPSFRPASDDYNTWIEFDVPGHVCADDTQYKYFVKFREGSDNLLVLYEGGGACWDFKTCTAAEGSRGALGVDCVLKNREREANGEELVDCIPDDYADRYFGLPDSAAEVSAVANQLNPNIYITDNAASIDTVLPLASSDPNVSPFSDWNLVFVPYCTADLYSGDKEARYFETEGCEDDPNCDEDPVIFRHFGLRNTLAVAEELDEVFPGVEDFAMNGCSAGGAAVMATYYLMRTRIQGIQNAVAFSDAGPFFPDFYPGAAPDEVGDPSEVRTSNSYPLHQKVRESWNASAIFDLIVSESDQIATEPEDISDIYPLLANEFPDDRFSVAYARTDFNYSLYSFTSFYGLGSNARLWPERKEIYRRWQEDNALMTQKLDGIDNISYYMPFWRKTNNAHCISLAGFEDVDINADELTNIIALVGEPATSYYAGTEIMVGDTEWTYKTHVLQVLDRDSDVDSILETEPEGPYAPCTPEGQLAFDTEAEADAACEAAVAQPFPFEPDSNGDD